MIIEFLRAFFLIFLAEMGDKSQLIAMAFATKYKIRNVLIGLSIGIFLNHAIAVFLGSKLNSFIPLETLSIIAGFLFIIFGLWSLKESEDEELTQRQRFGPIITVAIAFFIGELADKTQFTAIALSSDADYPMIILCGTVLGMIFTSLIGIYVGIKLGSKVPEFMIKVLSSMVFIVFGVIKLITSVEGEYVTVFNITVLMAIILTSYIILFIPLFKTYKSDQISAYQDVAAELKNYYTFIIPTLENICLGESHCGKCEGGKCLLGYTKDIVRKAVTGVEFDLTYIEKRKIKDFNRSKVIESLSITVRELSGYWSNKDFDKVHLIRNNLEMILFGRELHATSYVDYLNQLHDIDPEILKKVSI